MNFKKWVKSIQTVGYNGARTVMNLLAMDQNWRKENKMTDKITALLFP